MSARAQRECRIDAGGETQARDAAEERRAADAEQPTIDADRLALARELELDEDALSLLASSGC